MMTDTQYFPGRTVGVMAPKKGVHSLSLSFLLLSHMQLLGGVLKVLYVLLSLCLLNNLKPYFKGVEGDLGYHTRVRHRKPVRSSMA